MKILNLLNKRARIVLEIADIKRDKNLNSTPLNARDKYWKGLLPLTKGLP